MFATAYVLALMALAASVVSKPINSNTTCLPVIDLGYELHKASYNATTDVYQFLNIRFAQPPVGDLRFRAPLPPLVDRSTIRNGSERRICPQGNTPFQSKAVGVIAAYTRGKPFSLESWEHDITNAPPGNPDPNQFTTEDCLFLDVYVPRKVFHKAARTPGGFAGVPVLFSIFGGGFIVGVKGGAPGHDYNPVGFFKAAELLSKGDIIFVAPNYRVGGLGFFSGPGVDANAGLLDQRLALEWVQEHIHRFGGSPKHVTIMGESAGAGSVFFQLQAYGGEDGKSPFSQAILQSPATGPAPSLPENGYDTFLAALNVTTIEEARKLSSESVINANSAFLNKRPYNSYFFSPVVDGVFIKEPPFQTLAKGGIDKSVSIIASHNALEGSFLFDPNVTTEEDFKQWIVRSLPGLSTATATHAAEHIYPPQYDGSLGYVDIQSRQMKLFGEALVDCSFQLLHESLGGKGYAYQFSVSPGLHTQDLTYTFTENPPAIFPEVSEFLQQTIVNFALTGVPKSGGVALPKWGQEMALLNITETGNSISKSNVNQTRCDWWQKGIF